MVTSHSLLTEARTLAVFDIETRLDPASAAAAGYKGSGMPTPLQSIATACILVATERPDGQWGDIRLHTFADPLSEFDILMQLDEAFSDLASRNALLATYNGRAHDLAVLRRRGARHWMFGLPGIAAATTMGHLDIMLRHRLGRQDGAASLREACAALSISAFDPRTADKGSVPASVRKCQTDVVATFLLALYETAMDRGSPDALVSGWGALSDHLSAMRPRLQHLEHFRDHALLRAARRVG